MPPRFFMYLPHFPFPISLFLSFSFPLFPFSFSFPFSPSRFLFFVSRFSFLVFPFIVPLLTRIVPLSFSLLNLRFSTVELRFTMLMGTIGTVVWLSSHTHTRTSARIICMRVRRECAQVRTRIENLKDCHPEFERLPS